MPIVPLYGHAALRERLDIARRRGSLPQSLLLHGPAGVGKQRLALWLAQTLVCEHEDAPCETCRHCKYARGLTHPDIMWAFPLPRPKEGDRGFEDARADLQQAGQDRAEASGLYAAPSGSDGIFIATVKMLVTSAAMSPALAPRKIYVVGDADRMVPQEGAEFAANAFLKLLEEPPRNTFLVLTTSAVSSLLPTIRSRVVAVRVAPLPERDTGAFLDDPAVDSALAKRDLPTSRLDRIALAGGAPGRLLSSAETDAANRAAQTLLDAAASGNRATILRAAFLQGASGARGAFSDILEALTSKLHARARHATQTGDDRTALAASRAVGLVEDAKLLAAGNVNPQLLSARLLTDMASLLA
jgi:DNA polymerase-3 subunit delta'